MNTILAILSLLITLAQAHTRLFHIDAASGKKQTCIRPKAVGKENFPTFDINSPDMQCGPSSPHTSECAVQAGETIYMAWGEGSFPDHFVSPSHKGNPNIYLGPRDASGTPPRDGWFKIWQGEWDPVEFWYNDKLIKQATPGYLPVTIPANLKPGTYFLRGETTGLHQAQQYPGIQFFIFCAAITVTGNGNAVPSASDIVSIPGYLTPTSPGVAFDLYSQKLPDGKMLYDAERSGQMYPTLGPKVAALAANGSYPTPPRPGSTSPTTDTPPPPPPPPRPHASKPYSQSPPPPRSSNPYTQSPPPPKSPSPTTSSNSLPINNPPPSSSPSPSPTSSSSLPVNNPPPPISSTAQSAESVSSSLSICIDSTVLHLLAALLFFI